MVFNELAGLTGLSPVAILLLGMLVIFEGVLKAITLWKSGRAGHLAWFICIFVFNTVGILPIIYLLFFQKKSERRQNRSRRKRR